MRSIKGQFLKGYRPYNYGARKKLICKICGITFIPKSGSLKQKCCSIKCRTTFLTGKNSPLYGKTWICSPETCRKRSQATIGKNHWNWKGGITKTKEYKRLYRQRYRALKKRGGKLTIKTIQKVYEDNIKKYRTLTCVYCVLPIQFGKDTLEHKIPLSRSGTNEYSNLAIACKSCNCKKHNRTLEEWKGFKKMDILEQLRQAGFTPQENEDKGFEPVNGKYICRIDSAGRQTGNSKKTGEPYDFFAVNVQVAEIVDGDKATNRFLRLRYNPDADGIKKLLNDLFTAGIAIEAKTEEELAIELELLKDKTLNIRAWAWTPEKDRQGNVIPEENRVAFQQLRVVKAFTGKNKPETIEGNVPF